MLTVKNSRTLNTKKTPTIDVIAKNGYRLGALQTKIYEQAEQFSHSVLKNIEASSNGVSTDWYPNNKDIARSNVYFWTDPLWAFDTVAYLEKQGYIAKQPWYSGQTYFTLNF